MNASRLPGWLRSEEHTSELQSQSNLVCSLLLEKKKPMIVLLHRKGNQHYILFATCAGPRLHHAAVSSPVSYLFLYVCHLAFFFLITRQPPKSTLFPYTTLFR